MHNANKGTNNKTLSALLFSFSKHVIWNNFIIKITISSCPGLSVPNSESLLNEILKKVKENKYRNFIILWFFFEKISLIIKKLKKIKKKIELKWKE